MPSRHGLFDFRPRSEAPHSTLLISRSELEIEMGAREARRRCGGDV